MPLLVHVVVGWIAGLFIGQLWYAPIAVAAALVAACLALATSHYRLLAAGACLASGLLVGRAAQRAQEGCRRDLLARFARGDASRLQVDIGGVAPTGLRGMFEFRSGDGRHACRVPATARVRGTTPPEGSRVALRGTALRTERGVAVRDAVLVGREPARGMARWRARAAVVIDRHFRTRAPLVRALLIADQAGLPRLMRERYADAGLVHMLSVSGMHVAIIWGALLTLAGAVRLPRRQSEALAMLAVTAYVAVLGCPAPAVRSAVMLLVTAIATRWQRPLHDWTALALGAAVPTIEPMVVTDLGWQLSVGGMAALVAARAWRRSARAWAEEVRDRELGAAGAGARWLVTRRGGIGWIAGEIFTGLVATVITAPLIAWTFGRISLVAPLSNVAAAPVIAVLQPALFLALLLAPWPMLAGAVADASQPAMALLDRIAEVAAGVPFAVLPVAPTAVTCALTVAAAALAVRGSAARRRAPWMQLAAGFLVLAMWAPLAPAGNGWCELHVIDVGQGDALAVRTPRGRWMLVDAGPRWDGGDAGARAVLPHLRRYGGAVALMVLSHAHEDHVGGAESLLRAQHPALWWEPAYVTTSAGYRAALQAVRERGVRWRRVHPGERWSLDGVTVTVLAPDSAWTAAQVNANETSVVLRVEYGRTRWLLTGDAERDEEAWLLRHYAPDVLRADVLKLGHHGSRTSSTAPFVDAVRPRVAVASVGTGNRYGHPAPETLAGLLARDVPVFRTDLDGTVIVRSDGRDLEVVVGDTRWRVPERR